MSPRRLAAFGVLLGLAVAMATAPSSHARTTMVWTGGNSTQPGESFTRYTQATGSTAPDPFNQYFPGVERREFMPGLAQLRTYKCVMLWVNQTALTGTAINPLRDYIIGGGTVLAVGEYGTYFGGIPNAAMNAMAAGIGSTMRMGTDNIGFGVQSVTSNLSSHPFMRAVGSIFYAVSSSVSLGANGQWLSRAAVADGGTQVTMAAEQIGTGQFVMIPDSNVVGDSPGVGYTDWGNGTFFNRICGDNEPPGITITRPAHDGRYRLGDAIGSSYACTDEALVSCTGPVVNGSPFDTATAGTRTFTVDAVDVPGNTSSRTNTYFVDGTPPDITFRVPSQGLEIDRGSTAVADFGCADPDPRDTATVTASTVPNGTLINTSVTGSKTFSVTCSDLVGNSVTRSVTYMIVDRSPPEISISVPNAAGQSRYRLNQPVDAVFSCADPDGPLDIAFCTPSAAVLPTAVGGTHQFTVFAEDLAGNTAQRSTTYFVDESPPQITIAAPTQGARYRLGQAVSASYSCSDTDDTASFNDIVTCAGPVASGALLPTSTAGTKTFKVDASDRAGNTASRTITYVVDASPPQITISAPVDGARYRKGQIVPAAYTCEDADGPGDIALCSGPVAPGVPIDTANAGTHSFRVDASDRAGNTATRTVSYVVDDSAPQVTITIPEQGARYRKGQVARADYSCSDSDGAADIVLCAGPVANGARLDTATAGAKSFTVNAQDRAGNTGSATVSYFVDDSPPVITIAVPVHSTYYRLGQVVPAAYTCSDPDGPQDVASCQGTVAVGEPIDTEAAGTKLFTVSASDQVGNTASLTVTYVVNPSPPEITIAVPKQDARVRVGQNVAASYSCSDPDGPLDLVSCVGTVPNGDPIDTAAAGARTFTVEAADRAGHNVVKSVTYVVDGSPPAVTITVPADGGVYTRGEPLNAAYSCDDEDGGDDVVSCSGPVADGGAIATGVTGEHVFTVSSADRAGNQASATAAYTIVDRSPPTIAITSPADGAVYTHRSTVNASYACMDADGPSDVRSCAGPVRSGQPIDTATPGAKTFEVKAADLFGNTASAVVQYTVAAAPTPAAAPPPAPAPAVAPAPPAAAVAPTKVTAKKVCRSRRSFTIRIKRKRGLKIRSATITLNGKRQKAKKGKRFTGKVVLTGLKKGTYTLRITVKLSDGRTVRRTRRFRTCVPKSKSKKPNTTRPKS